MKARKLTERVMVLSGDVSSLVDSLLEQAKGRLLRRGEFLGIDDPFLLDELLQNTPQIDRVQGFVKDKSGWVCSRCGTKDAELRAIGPCTCCHKECFYCLACLQMGKIKRCSWLYTHSIQEESVGSSPTRSVEVYYKGQLSKEQAAISQELVDIYHRTENKNHLVWAVTGAGKTEMVFAVIKTCLEENGRVAIVSPRIDVCLELAPRLCEAFPNQTHDLLYGESPSKYSGAEITVATTHQMLRFNKAFQLIIVDEVDAFPYTNQEMLPYAVSRALSPNGQMIQLTATPTKEIHKQIAKNQLSLSILPARYHQKPLPQPSYRWIGDWQLYLKQGQLPPTMKAWIKGKLHQKKVFLLFVPSIISLEPLELALKSSFPLARFTTVSSVDPQRVEKIANMRKQEYDFLVTTTILERGVTFPGVDVFVLGAEQEIFSRQVLVQIAGRVGRTLDCSRGQVIFGHFGKSRAMVEAKKEIRQMNRLARQKNLIK